MKKLTIFDDGEFVATVSLADNGGIYIFARSSREWSEIKRLTTYIASKDKYLEKLAAKAHEFSYSTELLNG